MIFDINNPPSQPDSDLDPDMTNATDFTLADGTLLSIAPGDWVDVDPAYINPDPNWGFSFQVCNVYPDAGAVGILILVDPVNDTYSESQLTVNPEVTNNFRRVPKRTP